MPKKTNAQRPRSHQKTNRPRGTPVDRSTPRQAKPAANTIRIYGRHAVFAALTNKRREIERIYITEPLIETVRSKRQDVPIAVIEPNGFRTLLPDGAVHQSIAADIRPLDQPALETVLSWDSTKLLVALDQVTDPHNVGAIFRSAAAYGASGVILQDKHAPGETGTLARAASGGLDSVPWITVTNLSRALDLAKAAGFWTIGLDGQSEVDLQAAVSGAEKLCLVLGAEGAGLRHNVASHCDQVAKLKIDPRMESLNVSNAAAVSLYICAHHRGR